RLHRNARCFDEDVRDGRFDVRLLVVTGNDHDEALVRIGRTLGQRRRPARVPAAHRETPGGRDGKRASARMGASPAWASSRRAISSSTAASSTGGLPSFVTCSAGTMLARYAPAAALALARSLIPSVARRTSPAPTSSIAVGASAGM